jgi:hypothetical protein
MHLKLLKKSKDGSNCLLLTRDLITHPMKISKLLLLSVAVLLFSCGDDDPKPAKLNLVGSWAITAIDYTGTTSLDFLGSTIVADFTGTGKNMNLTATFSENPNLFSMTGSYTVVLVTTVQGTTTTQETQVDDASSAANWSLTNEILTLTTPDLMAQTGSIIEQTANSFKFKAIVTDIDSSNDTEAVDMEITYTFERK